MRWWPRLRLCLFCVSVAPLCRRGFDRQHVTSRWSFLVSFVVISLCSDVPSCVLWLWGSDFFSHADICLFLDPVRFRLKHSSQTEEDVWRSESDVLRSPADDVSASRCVWNSSRGFCRWSLPRVCSSCDELKRVLMFVLIHESVCFLDSNCRRLEISRQLKGLDSLSCLEHNFLVFSSSRVFAHQVSSHFWCKQTNWLKLPEALECHWEISVFSE